jgi:hypothetical protein
MPTMRRYLPHLKEEPSWRMLGAGHKLAKGRVGVTLGISQVAKAAKVKLPTEARRLATWLAGKRLLTFDRGRVALTPLGLNVVGDVDLGSP